jgi:acyl carrier protein
MSHPITAAHVRELISGADTMINFKELKDSTPFKEAGADSLDVFNVTVAIEEAYGIKIPSDHLGQVNTVDNIVRYLSERSS